LNLLAIAEKILPKKLQAQMLILISALALFHILVSGLIHSSLVVKYIEEWTGEKAVSIAKTFAANQLVRENIANDDRYRIIQNLSFSVMEETGAEYVVVANRKNIRLSHPKRERIGGRFAGGDTERALLGESYYSRGTGTLGPALRGFSPVKDDNDEVIGFVAVGFMMSGIKSDIQNYLIHPMFYVTVMSLTAILCAVFITRYLRRQTMGLDPAEITSLFTQKNAVIHAVREGVIAIDADAELILINRSALNYLEISKQKDAKDDVASLPFYNDMESVLSTGIAESDKETVINGYTFIFNIVPVFYENQVKGAVVSFRRKDEINDLYNRLCKEKEYSEMLRAQAHEYSNTMHTIGGLIQVGECDEALSMILQETIDYEQVISDIKKTVAIKRLRALLIGKYNRSKELKIEFNIDKSSSLKRLPVNIKTGNILTIAGNLINNAFDAVLINGKKEKTVNFFISDTGSEMMLEVEDSGVGLDPEMHDLIFEKGFSLKDSDRGYGLYLVKQAVAESGGEIFWECSESGGCLFTVIIPKRNLDEKYQNTDS